MALYPWKKPNVTPKANEKSERRLSKHNHNARNGDEHRLQFWENLRTENMFHSSQTWFDESKLGSHCM
jgi:hypothetical protein